MRIFCALLLFWGPLLANPNGVQAKDSPEKTWEEKRIIFSDFKEFFKPFSNFRLSGFRTKYNSEGETIKKDYFFSYFLEFNSNFNQLYIFTDQKGGLKFLSRNRLFYFDFETGKIFITENLDQNQQGLIIFSGAFKDSKAKRKLEGKVNFTDGSSGRMEIYTANAGLFEWLVFDTYLLDEVGREYLSERERMIDEDWEVVN